MVAKIKNSHGSWTFVIPVYGLVFSSDSRNEFRVNQVTFISRDKLFRLRKRFGIFGQLKEMSNSGDNNQLKNWSDTFAVVQRTGKAIDLEGAVVKLVREELDILALSQLGWAKRNHNAAPSIELRPAESHKLYTVNTTTSLGYSGFRTTGKWRSLKIDLPWMKYQNERYFIRLMGIIQGKHVVQKKWRDTLTRVARLVGRSQTTTWLPNAFILNMIAIETLLTSPDDKYSKELPKRIEAFIGWVGYWRDQDYKTRIDEVYKKRCQYVHNGNDTEIEVRDLLFTDDILFNLLYNIVSHYKLFSSKDKIVEFSDKVAAEKILGLTGKKSKVRPKTLNFISRMYNEKDYETI